MSEENPDTAAADGEEYNLIFFPKIAEGENADSVKQKLAKTLKVDMDKVEGWYIAEAPTVLLKGVTQDVAERYMEAILQCGAACNIQAAGEGGLSLVPKTRNIDFFICPSCMYEEEVPAGTKFEQCPKCGLVMAKWEEKMKEEREREQIRRRLMRDARLKDDDVAERERKQKELERLRAMEREIMKELGIKPPGPLWMFFEKYPFLVSSGMGIFLITMTAIGFYYLDKHLEAEAHAELVKSQPSEEVAQVAPMMAAAVQLQQNGNTAVVAELADVTTKLRGDAQSRQEIIEMAQQMMKGADSEPFIEAAMKMTPAGTATLPGPELQAPAPVNLNTLGGVEGIKGVEQFNQDQLKQMAPPLLEHGHDEVLQVLTTRRMEPDPLNPEMNMVVDEIDEMDGSMIVDLMNTLAKDQEWDLYIARNVQVFLNEGEPDAASELANRIKNPAVKIAALGDVMVYMVEVDENAILKLPMSRVRLELDKIESADLKAMVLLDLGRRLSDVGYELEPAEAISRVLEMIRDTTDSFEKSHLSARTAVAYLHNGDRGRSRQYFGNAINQAAQISDLGQRIAAFSRISQRYYDARNVTLASEILAEAQVLAATRLEPVARSQALGAIAMAQGYQGDIEGALLTISNAGEGEGALQLKAKLAESLIGVGKFYEAEAILDELSDEVEYNRLQGRIVMHLIHDGKVDQARARLGDAPRRIRLISSASERGLLLSQFARLSARAGMDDQARALFEEALGLSSTLRGRKQAVNRGLVGLDQARSLWVGEAVFTMEEVSETFVKDPIDTEILATRRIITTLMPESVREALDAGS